MRDRVFERLCLARVDECELEARGRLMLREESAFGRDDQRFGSEFVAGLAEVD